MARTKVTDPASGAVVEVDSKSPLAKLWKSTEETKAPAKKATSSKSEK